MTERFTLDEAKARTYLTAREDGLPWLTLESPAGDIDQLWYDVAIETECVHGPDGHRILLYALRYSSDPDGVLIVVARPYPAPNLVALSADWDDIAPRFEDFEDRELDVDQALDIVAEIIRYANEALDREATVVSSGARTQG